MGERRNRWSILWLLGCAALFLTLAVSSARRKSATFDEPVYIVAGLSYLTLGTFTMKDDAPPLVGYLAGISPAAHGLRIPGGRLGFSDSFGREYQLAANLLYRSGADADGIVFWSRLAILVPFGLLLLFAVWAWAGRLFGPLAGAVATLLCAASPNLIAHGRLVAADFPSTAAMIFACYQLHRFVEAPSRARALAVGGSVGLALAIKFSALLLLPVLAVVLALLAWRERPLRGRTFLALVVLVVLPILVCTTLVYGSLDVTAYWRGVANVYRNLRPSYDWFFFGKLWPGGTWLYYFGVLAVKASAPLLLLGLTSLLLIRRHGRGLLAELILFLPAVLILVAAANDRTSAGVRRVLLVLPILAIAASRWTLLLPSWRRWLAVPLGLLLAWHVTSSVAAWPHYIPYFNEVAGGRAAGPRLLDDSNIDWGQDLKALPAVLERHGIDRVHLYYHGQAVPEYYGIHQLPIAPVQLLFPTPGYYAMSLHFLIRMQEVEGGWLGRFTPLDRAGTSILVFKIGG